LSSSYPKYERFQYLLKGLFANKIVDSLNDNPHQMTDEEYQLYENCLYFMTTAYKGRRAISLDNVKLPCEPDCFINYNSTLDVLSKCPDLLENTQETFEHGIKLIQKDISVVMEEIAQEIRVAIDEKQVNKKMMIKSYMFFQELRKYMINKSILIARHHS